MGQEIVWYGTAGAVLIQWSAGADALVSHVRFVFLHGLLGWQAEDRYGAECAVFHLLLFFLSCSIKYLYLHSIS